MTIKYFSDKYRFVQEHRRMKLPGFVEKITSNPSYITINYPQSNHWDNIKKSNLIESFLLNFPVPPIIIYETTTFKYKVIDGKQRLRAIVYFYQNHYSLTELKIITDLNSFSYANLPAKIQNILNNSFINYINLMPKWDDDDEKVINFIEVIANRLSI